MAFTYILLQLPTLLLLAMLLFFAIGISALTTQLFRKYVRLNPNGVDNEGVGFIFAAAGGLYFFLLAFTVFVVWDQYNQAKQDTETEASVAMGLYRDIRYYPDSVASEGMERVFVTYIHSVLHDEFPAMERMEESDPMDQPFNALFKMTEGLNSDAAYLNFKAEEIFRHLNEMATLRNLRTLAAYSELSYLIWIPIILGAIFIMVFAMLLDVKSSRLQMLMNMLLSALLAMAFYLILIFDHPFTGQMKIESKSFERILKFTDEQSPL